MLQLILDSLNHGQAACWKARNQIANKAQAEISKEQRDYWLRQQLRAIQDELGETQPEKAEVGELRERMEKADLPDHVLKEADRELKRLERLPSAAPDYQVTRTYLELVLELPWKKSSESVIDLKVAKEVLDADHFDLVTRRQGAYPRTSRRPQAEPGRRRRRSCACSTPGVGQDIARTIDRQGRRFALS